MILLLPGVINFIVILCLWLRSPAEQEAEAGGGWIVGGERKPNGKLERARIRGLLALSRCDSNESDRHAWPVKWEASCGWWSVWYINEVYSIKVQWKVKWCANIQKVKNNWKSSWVRVKKTLVLIFYRQLKKRRKESNSQLGGGDSSVDVPIVNVIHGSVHYLTKLMQQRKYVNLDWKVVPLDLHIEPSVQNLMEATCSCLIIQIRMWMKFIEEHVGGIQEALLFVGGVC